ncbi:MAG: hypothetical protein CAF45_015445 [Nitrospira sp. CG24E]|nr:MAG: hypothetical protein CAF45_015445 [Nitrospira sp. CG24E]
MNRHSFILRLLMLIALGASMNACTIANHQIAAQEPKEGRTKLTSKYDGPVYFVIPEYYQIYRCGTIGMRYEDCHGPTGTNLEKGVSASLNDDMPFGRFAVFTEHIPSEGLVCIITLNEKPVADTTFYIELLSALTMGLTPFYTTHEYVLSYTFLFDFRTVKEYQYTIAKKAMLGVLTGVLVPVVYPFWGDEIAMWDRGGPSQLSAKIVREITKRVFIDARREGIL